MQLPDEIRMRLAALAPVRLDIEDDSARHAGHAGNGGGGHFTITIVSSHFSGKSRIMRHRVVYQALEDLIPARIHALSIRAHAPDEP
ncbi:transcriptional regulator BolA [mine drainage metagenome]|uniref:Transcriptional regulator BolA n=1 Tax=mine drainage metagenome TaxID=410659 RepID=A0A1J5R973_9ZZZZ